MKEKIICCPHCGKDINLNEPRDAKKNVSYPTEEFIRVIDAWGKFFPGKAQPRPDTLIHRNKFATRWREKFFRENWYKAMERASKSTFLQSSGFFSFQWFLGKTKKHGLHVEKILTGAYDDLKSRNNGYAISNEAEKEWRVIEQWIKAWGSRREPNLQLRAKTAISLIGGYKSLCLMESQYAKKAFVQSYREAASR
jgi:hypothetical protein